MNAKTTSLGSPPRTQSETPQVEAAPVRGLQAEKSASTRARILEAVVSCLVELGYARTTTVEVADRAGVSRGAMLHHYPSKAELLYATLEYLHERQLDFLRRGVEKFRPEDDVVDASMTLLWALIKHPQFDAMQELILAARTDPELRSALLPLSKRLEEEFVRTNQELFSRYVAEGAPFEEMRDLTRFVLDGLGMNRVLHEDDAFARRTLEFLKRLIRELLVNPKVPS